MDYYNRALKSIQKRPGKSLLLLMLVFILGTIIIGAIAVERAVTNTEANLRNQMRPLISFDMDQASLMNEDGSFASAEPITANIARRISELPQVSQHHYMIGTSIQTHELMDYFSGREHHLSDGFPGQFWIQGGSTETPLQFNEGVLNLVVGDYFSTSSLESTNDISPIIVSQELAEINHLTIGSLIELRLDVFNPQPSQLGVGAWEENWNLNPENIYATALFQLEVIGLFELPVEEETEPLNLVEQAQINRQRQTLLNTIFTTNNTAETIQNFQMSSFVSSMEAALAEIGSTLDDITERDLLETSFTSVMELYNAREIDAFKALAYEILPDYWLITDLSNSFETLTASMDSLLEIGRWTLVSSIGATILILSLLITLSLHDRRHEIGIYSALGEKKAKIITQLFIEMMVIAIIGMCFAVFAGSMISENMSQTMIENQLMANQAGGPFFDSNPSQLSRLGFNQEMTVEDMVETFEMTLNVETVLLFFGTGIVVITLSTIVPIFYITNLKPKRILMES